MTVLGLIFIPWTLLVIVRGAHNWVPWLLAAAMPFMTASAVISGGNKISPFYVAAFAPLILLFVGSSHARKARSLYVLGAVVAAYFVITAVILPNVFAGTEVLVPRGGVDSQILDPGDLVFTVSNVAQAAYAVLSVAIVLHLAQHPPARKHFLAFGFAVGTTLNVWALINQLTGIYFPSDVFDAVIEGGVRYDSFFGADQRLRGVFSEPSYLAVFSVAGLIYSVALMPKVVGRQRLWIGMLAAGNVAALYFSFSGTAVAALGVVLLILAVIGVATLASGKVKVPPTAAGITLIVGAFSVLIWPTIYDYAQGIVDQKLLTSSYSNRSGSNAFSWELVRDTGGLGVGLGSNRPSSFALLLLSNVGLVGTALFVILVVAIVRRALKVGGFEPELLALLSVLTAKVIAEPNLGNPTMWCALAACAAAFGTTTAEEERSVADSPRSRSSLRRTSLRDR